MYSIQNICLMAQDDPWKSGTKLDIVNLPVDSLMILTDFLVNYMGVDNIKFQ